MRINRRIAIIIVIAVIVTLVGTVFAGCKKGVEEVSAEGAAGGVFRIYIHEPVFLDPPNCYESEGIQVIRQVFDGLVKYDPKTLETVPAMAESWNISDDGLVYTFYLEKGVKFHSGREVTAEDFVYSWTRAVLKENATILGYHLEPIVGYDECVEGTADTLAGVKALDDYTFEVTLKYNYGEFINTLGHVVFFPVAKEDIEEYGDLYTEHINGNGPFKFVEWKHDQYIELVRNDDYWGDKAYLDSAKFVIYADENTAFLDFKAGNLERADIPVGKVESTISDPKWKDCVIIKPTLSVNYWGMIVHSEPFKDNLALREAICYAVDKQNMCEVLSEGVHFPATGVVPEGIPGFQENAIEYTYDPEKAKEKLVEAGYPDGEGLPTLSLGINIGAGHEIYAEAFQADLKEIGINIEIGEYEWGTALEKMKKGEINFFRLGWLADYPIMDNFLFPLFYSTAYDNYTQYNNPEVDELLLKARQTIDKEERIATYREVERMILKDAPCALVWFYGSRKIIQPYVKGFYLSGMEDYDLSKVWLENE